MRARKQFLHTGPNLHLFVVTLRCNETCVYCHASRADMDAVHTDMTPEIATAAAIKPGQGAIVIEVAPDSPAARAGLRRGDLVLSLNWLGELCATDLPADDLAHRLTFAGFEVEGREEREHSGEQSDEGLG